MKFVIGLLLALGIVTVPSTGLSTSNTRRSKVPVPTPQTAHVAETATQPLNVPSVVKKLTAAAFIVSSCLFHPLTASADEYGREIEAPTISTGETVEICKKRGPLGACVKTEMRTVENDNDKAEKYFKGGKNLQSQQLSKQREEESGNELIEKLRQQSVDNKDKNELIVAQKTFENDQSATFGPFDKQVLVMNTDGKTFTLLSNPQATRLKDSGFIKGRKFVKQPSAEEIDAAAKSELPAFIRALVGSE